MVRQVERSLLFLILIEDLHLSLLNVIQHVGVIDVTQVHILSCVSSDLDLFSALGGWWGRLRSA